MRKTLTLLVLLCASLRALAVQVALFVDPARCGLNNGSVIASASGGIPPYTFSWSNGATTASISDLAPGDYTVTVTDGLSNTDQAIATVLAVNELGEGGLIGPLQPDCQGLCTGIVISMAPYGGAPPYNYPPEVFVDGPNSFTIMGVCANMPYIVNVSDANGCLGTITVPPFYVEAVEPSTVLVQGATPACQGQSNGSMTLFITAGAASAVEVNRIGGGYSQTHFPALQVPYVVNGLPAGDYEIISSIQGAQVPVLCSSQFSGSVPEIPSPCGGVSGRVYHDADQNCTYDGFDLPIPNKVLEITPGPSYAITNDNGNYTRGLNFGAFAIGQTLINETQICPANNPQAFALSAGSPQATVDFANLSNAPHDLQLWIGSYPARPGFETSIHLTVYNNSSFPSGAVAIDLSFDPLLMNPLPADGHWDIAVIPPFSYVTRTFSAMVPPDIALLGTVLAYSGTVSNTATEPNIGNNAGSINVTVTGSYDPNDKQGTTSSGFSPTQYFLGADEWIDYTVRFQNTGTDTAFTVVVRDEIDTDLDLTSLQLLGSSHAFTPSFGDGRELVFTFEEILLPDSTTDLLGSQGFISFRLKPNQDIIVGDVLENTAVIHFDFNPPIITNTMSHVVDFSTGAAEAQRLVIRVWPNPAAEALNIELPAHAGCTLEVLSADGRAFHPPIVRRADGAQIDTRSLAPGAYVLRCAGSSTRFMKW